MKNDAIKTYLLLNFTHQNTHKKINVIMHLTVINLSKVLKVAASALFNNQMKVLVHFKLVHNR